MLRVAGIEGSSSLDWYGNLCTVFFLSGCNFSCKFCHNYRLINPREGKDYSTEEIKDLLTYHEPLIDGVVFSGGEPTLQAEGLIEACKMIREEWPEWGIMLNTNGSNEEVVYRLLKEGLIDRIAIDIKAPLKIQDYNEIISVPSWPYLTSIMSVIKWAKHYEIELEGRTTIVPGLTDDPLFLKTLARQVHRYIDEYYLQECDTKDILDKEIQGRPPVSRDIMIALAKVVIGEGMKNVHIKTRGKGLERISGPSQ